MTYGSLLMIKFDLAPLSDGRGSLFYRISSSLSVLIRYCYNLADTLFQECGASFLNPSQVASPAKV